MDTVERTYVDDVVVGQSAGFDAHSFHVLQNSIGICGSGSLACSSEQEIVGFYGGLYSVFLHLTCDAKGVAGSVPVNGRLQLCIGPDKSTSRPRRGMGGVWCELEGSVF